MTTYPTVIQVMIQKTVLDDLDLDVVNEPYRAKCVLCDWVTPWFVAADARARASRLAAEHRAQHVEETE